MIGLAMANDTPSVTRRRPRPGHREQPAGICHPDRVEHADPARHGDEHRRRGKVAAAHALGQLIPGDWVVDVEGRPSTDPATFLSGGALTPMAGHKGYGLAILIESLSAVLTGAAITSQVVPWIVGDPTVPTGHGAAFIAINIAAMMPIDTFKCRVDAMAREIRESPLADGADRIYLPGEIEWVRRRKSLVEGIVLPEDVRRSVLELSRALDIVAPRFATIAGPLADEPRIE